MIEGTRLWAITHGTYGLIFGYLAVWIPFVVGLARHRAPAEKYFNSLWMAVPVYVVGRMVLWSTSPLFRALGAAHDGYLLLIFGSGVMTALGYVVGRSVALGNHLDVDDSYRRSAAASRAAAVRNRPERREVSERGTVHDRRIRLAGIPIDPEDETRHFKFIGMTGSGRSTAIREMLSVALAREDRAIIADPDGAYARNFYQPERGDVILDTFDPDAPSLLRQWLRQGAAGCNGGRGGVLFLPYKAGEIALRRSMIPACLSSAIVETTDGPEADKRLWLLIDELDALGEIDGLEAALARLRKFGCRCVLGVQSIAEFASTYGQGVADSILANCGTALIVRCSATGHDGTSEFASRLLGQREADASEKRTLEFAVTAAEIERLPDLVGYLKFASFPNWGRVTLTDVSYPRMGRSPRPVTATAPAEPLASASAMGHLNPEAMFAEAAAARPELETAFRPRMPPTEGLSAQP